MAFIKLIQSTHNNVNVHLSFLARLRSVYLPLTWERIIHAHIGYGFFTILFSGIYSISSFISNNTNCNMRWLFLFKIFHTLFKKNPKTQILHFCILKDVCSIVLHLQTSTRNHLWLRRFNTLEFLLNIIDERWNMSRRL